MCPQVICHHSFRVNRSAQGASGRGSLLGVPAATPRPGRPFARGSVTVSRRPPAPPRHLSLPPEGQLSRRRSAPPAPEPGTLSPSPTWRRSVADTQAPGRRRAPARVRPPLTGWEALLTRRPCVPGAVGLGVWAWPGVEEARPRRRPGRVAGAPERACRSAAGSGNYRSVGREGSVKGASAPRLADLGSASESGRGAAGFLSCAIDFFLPRCRRTKCQKRLAPGECCVRAAVPSEMDHPPPTP